ncbi:MAG TPA: universal stress protein [Jiangellaceae bacterium]
MSGANQPVVVGIDGSESALVALTWAAREAAANGWPLHLVNAYEEVAIMPTLVAITAREAAESILNEAREHLRNEGFADIDVSTGAHHGFPRQVLLREAAGARALVLGREGAGLFSELVLGSTSLACATHGRIPVIVVPEAWRSAEPEQRMITLGVDGSPQCRSAVEYAFATASRWRARIVAVLAVRPAEPVLADGRGDAESRSQAERMLAEQLAGWRSKYLDVDVTEVVEPGHPAAVIKEHAADADLVVIGGRGHGVVTGMLLGSIARAVLHHVDRPIAIVHEPR